MRWNRSSAVSGGWYRAGETAVSSTATATQWQEQHRAKARQGDKPGQRWRQELYALLWYCRHHRSECDVSCYREKGVSVHGITCFVIIRAVYMLIAINRGRLLILIFCDL